MHGPDKTSMDTPFNVSLAARYYAGGNVSGQSAFWRVTQFPHTYYPKSRKGFLFSSDSRYSRTTRFRSPGVIEKTMNTDPSGSSLITIDPADNLDNRPRKYVFEATVTGADDQTVTATKDVIALPAFILGMKVERFIKKGFVIEPEFFAMDVLEKNKSDLAVTVRLLKKEWHSHLREAALADGKGQYITEEVVLPVMEKIVMTQEINNKISLKVKEAGIYVIEIEARDEMGRLQVITADVYVAGDTPVSWEKPKDMTFRTVTDRGNKAYDPGEKAKIILQSPFQEARCLVIVEKPDQNQFQWINVSEAQAVYELNIEDHFYPRIPVTFVLMRPRIYKNGKIIDHPDDIGKPQTLASTAWVKVKARIINPCQVKFACGL